MDLSKAMQKSLIRAGYETPTDVQGGLIPVALEGSDVIGQARTGTGKTASFVIPILELLDVGKDHHGPQAIILVPTRELAVQVRDEVVKLAFGRRLGCVAVYGGKPIRGQIEKLKQLPHVIVGTPGRVLDHIGRGTLDLRNIWCTVLDEADRMLDIGFRPDIEKILRKCPRDRQTFLLSATVPPPIERLARRYMFEPVSLNFSPKELSVETIEQHYFTVDNDRKFDLLVKLVERESPRQAIVFCRTKRGVDRLLRRLKKHVDSADSIHGDLPQSGRDSVMKKFREGGLRYLVATDVVGRGIDVSGISHIINFDIPMFCDDYIHRVGRTGRMGREGIAFTFVTPEEGPELTRIEQRINVLLIRDEFKDFEASALVTEDAAEEKAPPPEPPSNVSSRRAGKRYRRAL
jgi:ATP-dependent RNA helicase DeaD